MYTCIHVGGTCLPIPSRSGRDDVDTLGSKTPVNDDSNIGKCDNVFFLPCVGARWGGKVAWRYSTVGKGSHLAGHLPEKKKRSSDPLHLMRAAHARTRAMIKMRSFSAITPCMPQCVHTYIT